MKNQLKHDTLNQSVILCCGSKRCPVVSTDGDNIKIKDDFGQTVTMSKQQAKMISEAVDMLEDNND
jgi:hypothetical protein